MPSVVILGAGPAGSLAATLLARGGWDVTLVEQHVFPREKVCGECLSSLGIDVLSQTGLADAVRKHEPVRLNRALLVPATGAETSVPLKPPMWGVTREALDGTLLEAARLAGARVLQPVRCEQLQPADAGKDKQPRVALRDLVSNHIIALSADVVLLADGKGALGMNRPKPSGDLGVKAHFEGVDGDGIADAICLFGLAGHYVGLAPVERNRWNLAMSVPAKKVKAHGADLDRLFESILKENSALARRLSPALRIGDWISSPLPRFALPRTFPPGVIPLGNAAAALEPIGGEGMGLALKSAEIVANELLVCSRRRRRLYDEANLRRAMAKLWDRRMTGCRLGGLMMSRPRLSRVITPLIRPLAPVALRLVGK